MPKEPFVSNHPEAIFHAINFSTWFLNTLSIAIISSNNLLFTLSLFHLAEASWNTALYYFGNNVQG